MCPTGLTEACPDKSASFRKREEEAKDQKLQACRRVEETTAASEFTVRWGREVSSPEAGTGFKPSQIKKKTKKNTAATRSRSGPSLRKYSRRQTRQNVRIKREVVSVSLESKSKSSTEDKNVRLNSVTQQGPAQRGAEVT